MSLSSTAELVVIVVALAVGVAALLILYTWFILRWQKRHLERNASAAAGTATLGATAITRVDNEEDQEEAPQDWKVVAFQTRRNGDDGSTSPSSKRSTASGTTTATSPSLISHTSSPEQSTSQNQDRPSAIETDQTCLFPTFLMTTKASKKPHFPQCGSLVHTVVEEGEPLPATVP